MQDLTEKQAEIKVKTKKFSLRKGHIKICFELKKEKGQIRQLKLKQRNEILNVSYPFEMRTKTKGDAVVYQAEIDVNQYPMENAFWDLVAVVDQGNDPFDAVLGGLSAALKIKLILFPRWTRTNDGNMIYPFVNGKRQFNLQYRKYDRKYDSYLFLMKEFLALFCYFILKPYWDHKKLWLVGEKYCTMAQDNGFYFFRYCMEQLSEEERKKILYVIDKKSPDYQAVKKYEPNVIQFMSFQYMIYLSAAQYLISTDAIRHFYIWDSPISVYKLQYQARKNIIFLQHGVTAFKQCHKTYRKNCGNQMALFIVTSEVEQKIIQDHFGYDKEEIPVTGFARWDVLENKADPAHKEILLVPTWRNWLEDISEEAFRRSEYYQRYESLLQDKKLNEILEEENITLNFYIHSKFRERLSSFHTEDSRIRMIPFGSVPLNKLLMSCHLLITDYSSVAWEVYYQGKPVVFYPFDLDTYEKAHGSYVDYRKDVFGDLAWTQEELLRIIEEYIGNGFQEKEKFAKRRDQLLPYRDHDNSRRIYEAIAGAKLPNKLKKRRKDMNF